jgi:hypothetical protein
MVGGLAALGLLKGLMGGGGGGQRADMSAPQVDLPIPEDPLLKAAQARVGAMTPAGDPGAGQVREGWGSDLLNAVKGWWNGPQQADGQDPDAAAEEERRRVREAAARAMPDASGVPGAVDAMGQRRRLYQQVDDSGR